MLNICQSLSCPTQFTCAVHQPDSIIRLRTHKIMKNDWKSNSSLGGVRQNTYAIGKGSFRSRIAQVGTMWVIWTVGRNSNHSVDLGLYCLYLNVDSRRSSCFYLNMDSRWSSYASAVAIILLWLLASGTSNCTTECTLHIPFLCYVLSSQKSVA